MRAVIGAGIRAGRQLEGSRQASVTRASIRISASRFTAWSATSRARRSSTSVSVTSSRSESCAGLREVDFDAVHDEHDAVLALDGGEVEAQRREPFGARALHELEIVGVVDDAGGVGVLVVNADGEAKGLVCRDACGLDWPVRPSAPWGSPVGAHGAQSFAGTGPRRRASAATGRSADTRAPSRRGRATCAAGSPAGSGTARARPRSCRAPRRSPRRGCRCRRGRRRTCRAPCAGASGPSRRGRQGRRRASRARRSRPRA